MEMGGHEGNDNGEQLDSIKGVTHRYLAPTVAHWGDGLCCRKRGAGESMLDMND